jgi:hypothetical protein
MFEQEDDELFGQFEMGQEIGEAGLPYDAEGVATPGSESEQYFRAGWQYGVWKRNQNPNNGVDF